MCKVEKSQILGMSTRSADYQHLLSAQEPILPLKKDQLSLFAGDIGLVCPLQYLIHCVPLVIAR